ncbi:Protein of unknown function [Terribacillus aidingensis]|uniref:Dihydrodipicolinate synthase/N-acetylneuraminate lyase n=1 Tax=Terribacillus aidingensis TaxID=586416 RepID=A0A285P847_9BACI|nr:dihydrodipicolinate synthase family protein [Terribacillus aidingensis]SNZ17373.1 Protein of unknown function [Terribacillus aidingensis]
MTTILLPKQGGSLEPYKLVDAASAYPTEGTFRTRTAYSAAHVVADARASAHPILGGAIDWEATLAYRKSLWKLGFGVAEAMDTAQRGMGLTWDMAKELISISAQEAKKENALLASGAGTDHLESDKEYTLAEIKRAYEEQTTFVEGAGSRIILMASRALAASARSAADYKDVYGHVLKGVNKPVILHWLGPMFDPKLTGYWGTETINAAMDACLELIHQNETKIDGIKISLLDKDKEIEMRAKLPASVRMYTGDDFNYPELIQGDGERYSHALLGIFDAIAPAASEALRALDADDIEGYREIFDKTVPLARHIFETPTYAYKTGVVFLAYLNGYQSHFRMIGGAEGARSVLHLSELFRLADQAGVLVDPNLAVQRMQLVLKLAGIEQQVTT